MFDEPSDTQEDASPVEIKNVSSAIPPLQTVLNNVFAGEKWQAIEEGHADARADQCAELLRKAFAAKWASSIQMHDHSVARYFLLHLTNNPHGREYMKACLWKVCPNGYFVVDRNGHPEQGSLGPNLEPLRHWIRDKLNAGPTRWKDLDRMLIDQAWLSKHLNPTIKAMIKENAIECDGTATASANPMLSFPKIDSV